MAMTALNMDRMTEGRFFLVWALVALVIEDLHCEKFPNRLTPYARIH